MKHNDGLDAWLTALRHEMAQACMARACELPEKVMLGDDLPDDLPPDGGGPGHWRWLGVDALKIKNPEVMILGKESSLRHCGATIPLLACGHLPRAGGVCPAAAVEAGGGKDTDKMGINVKGIGEAVLLAALYNAAKPDEQDAMYSKHESMTKEEASELLDELSGHKANEPVLIRKLYGRRIYMYFWPGMKRTDATQYDNENGQGKAEKIVAAIYKEIAAKKNAERKAERAKRHRVAVYWQDDNDGICTIADGHSEHQNIMAAAYLLGTLLAEVPEERRTAEYNGAIMKVDEIIRECGRKGETDE